MALDYEEFKEVIRLELISYLGQDYESYEVKFNKVKKINRVLDGFSVVPIEDDSTNYYVTPTMYADDLYDDYLDSLSISSTLTKIAETIKYGIEVGSVNVEPFTNVKESRDRIVFEVINKKRNKNLLEDLPHREFLDLAIVYRLIATIENGGITSALVNKGILDLMEITEEELFDLAYENTMNLLPIEIKNMDQVVISMMKRDGSYTEEVEERLNMIPESRKLYVVTNKYTFCAANALIYEEIFDDISNKLNSDIYIIPISVNELIVMVASEENQISEILAMVRQSNSLDESLGEVLSDNVYLYDRDSRSIVIPYETY